MIRLIMTDVTKEPSLTCDYCHKTYSSKSNLKAHQQRTKKCIDARTNAILIKELIKGEHRDEKIESSPAKIYRVLKGEKDEKIDTSPANIYRVLSTSTNSNSGCKDCVEINSQLNSIMALNNKMFCQLLDICKQMNNLSIVMDSIQKTQR